MFKNLLLVVCVASVSIACGQTPKLKKAKDETIVFYNVENLFDTIDDPTIQDEDFLPTSKMKWNTLRYTTKLEHTAYALTSGLTKNPMLIGLVEIENESVLVDLIKTGSLAKTNYGIAHKNSPDQRGIDCALLYDKTLFQVMEMKTLSVKIDSIPDFKTRDILYVKGKMKGGKVLHVLVNHWPSRRGGEAESEIRRIQAANVARKQVDEILAADPKANILLMGDFNDHPDNKSILDVLKAKPLSDTGADLYNLLADDQAAGKGTHNYKGEWGVLDQFIVSQALLKGTNKVQLKTGDAVIVMDEKLLFTNKDGSKKPSSTYGGTNYFGGYSDHLPIQLMLK